MYPQVIFEKWNLKSCFQINLSWKWPKNTDSQIRWKENAKLIHLWNHYMYV